MKKFMTIVLIITLVVSFVGVTVDSNEAKANGPLSGSVNFGVGENYTVPYVATNNVDLEIWWYDQGGGGDDQCTIFVNSCNISTQFGGDNVTVSIGPGYYEIAFRLEFSGVGDTVPLQYIITPWTYTGNYIYPCIQPWLPPQPIPPVEVGGEVYPVDRLSILIPWVALVAVLIVGTAVAVRRRRAPS